MQVQDILINIKYIICNIIFYTSVSFYVQHTAVSRNIFYMESPFIQLKKLNAT